MTFLAMLLVFSGLALFVIMPETMIVGAGLMFAGFACVALDNHNHDEGR